MRMEEDRNINTEAAPVLEKRPVDREHVRILGRTFRAAGVLWLGYSASGIEFVTHARQVHADIAGITEMGDPSQQAYLAVITDGDEENARRIRVEKGMHTYSLCENEEGKQIRVRVVKLSEARNDKTGIACLRTDAEVYPSQGKDLKLLFIGDSLTAGYGVNVMMPQYAPYVFSTMDEDVRKAYPYLTANALDADFQMVCESGDGIISRCIDPGMDLPDTTDLIPFMYPYVDKHTEEIVRIVLSSRGGHYEEPGDTVPGPNGLSVYDPSEFVPDIIITNLGANDCTFTKGIARREEHFMKRYADFLRALSLDYPAARRLVTYGLTEKSLSQACREAAMLSDSAYLELPLQDPADGFGAAEHPSAETHRKTAALLTEKIRAMRGLA